MVLRIKSDVTQQWAQSSSTVSYEKLVPSVIQWSGSDNWFQSKVHVQHSSVVQRVRIARCRSRTKPASETLCGDNACDVITLSYVIKSRIQSAHRPVREQSLLLSLLLTRFSPTIPTWGDRRTTKAPL